MIKVAIPFILFIGIFFPACGKSEDVPNNNSNQTLIQTPVPEFSKFLDKAEKGEPVVVAYLGGSITQGASTWPIKGTDASGNAYDYSYYNPEKASWRALTFEWLRSKFEKVPGQFRQVNAAIGGTPSLLGAYRLEQDVLSTNPDLVFIEFAVNDNGVAGLTRDNPDAPGSILRTCCSIVSRLRMRNPDVTIFMPLSTHRELNGSTYTAWGKTLDLGHDQTLLAAEMLHVPYVSIKEAFYADSGNSNRELYYGGPDDAGNYVHPAPFGHQAYAKAVEAVLSDIFQKGTFSFSQKIGQIKPYPVNPRLILPETLLEHASGWQIETLSDAEAPILEGQYCLVPNSDSAVLEYNFKGTTIGLWLDTRSKGGMEVYLDGKYLGLYGNRVEADVQFRDRFCTLSYSLDSSTEHILKLIPVSMPNVPEPEILLLALTIDVG